MLFVMAESKSLLRTIFRGDGANVDMKQPRPSEILRFNKNVIQFSVPPQDESVLQSLGKLINSI